MTDGEPVTQKQFYTTIEQSNGKVLKAIGKVDEKVQANSVTLGIVETKLDNNDIRMDAQDDKIKIQDGKIDDQKKWNRGLAAIEGLLATVLVALGIRGD